MHSSEPFSDTRNSPVILDNGGQYRRKMVVVGLGMVALSFMCVVLRANTRALRPLERF